MEFEEDGKRKEYLKTILGFLAEVYSALSNGHRGIRAIRFLNGTDDDDRTADNMSQRDEIEEVIDNHEFEGLTRMGTGLIQKILRPFVFSDEKWDKKTPRKMRNMERPLLIMIITDGAVSLPI